MTTITLHDKVLAHLNTFKHIMIEKEHYVPQEITQDGIASAIGISRPHVSQILAGMVKNGELEVLGAYVNGASRPIRRKVYRLSPLGRQHYQTVRTKLTELGVDMDRIGINFNNCSSDEFRNMSPEDRGLFGCFCVLRITVRKAEIGRDLPLAVFDHNGILSLKTDAKKRFLSTGNPEDIRIWHSAAADWVLDHGNDHHERLYHLNNACRDVESLRLIRKSRHHLFDSRIDESAMITAEISRRCNEPEIRRIAALLALESSDTDVAEKMIDLVTEDDPCMGGAIMAELYLRLRKPKKALAMAQECYRGDVDTGIALGKCLLANESYLEARDCLTWVKKEMIRRGDLFRMDEVLCCQAETELNLDCTDEAMRIIITAKSLTVNPRILERLESLERDIRPSGQYSEDRILLEGVNV